MKVTPIIINRFFSKFALCLGFSIILLTAGCGGGTDAPYGSTITLSPSSSSLDTGALGTSADWPVVYVVTVTNSDGDPIPWVNLTISGSMANPNPIDAYQFYDGIYVVGGPNTPKGSPFSAQTDVDGHYTLTAVVPAGTGVFKDQVQVMSATATGYADIEVK